jgi:hypothetical protein
VCAIRARSELRAARRAASERAPRHSRGGGGYGSGASLRAPLLRNGRAAPPPARVGVGSVGGAAGGGASGSEHGGSGGDGGGGEGFASSFVIVNPAHIRWGKPIGRGASSTVTRAVTRHGVRCCSR